MDRASAARLAGMDRQTLRDWVHRYNAEGIAGLCNRPAPGRRPKLTEGQMAALKAVVLLGPDPAVDKIARWRIVDLCRWVEERWGVSMFHCFYCHGYEVAGQRLGVLAMSDRALQTAMLLPDWSEQVTLFTNGVLTLDPGQLAELSARGVSVEPVRVVALLGDAPGLSGLRLDDGRIIPLDGVFTNPRTRMASPLAEQLGCEFEEGPSGPFIRTGADKQTTIRGVYAAGDAARPGHNASWAAADGVTAGISAHQSLTLVQPECR